MGRRRKDEEDGEETEKGVFPVALPLEKKQEILRAWYNPENPMGYKQVAELTGVCYATVRSIILKYEEAQKDRQFNLIVTRGKPDILELKKVAWKNVVQMIYDGSFQVSKALLNGELKGIETAAKNKDKKESEKNSEEKELTDNAADAFGG